MSNEDKKSVKSPGTKTAASTRQGQKSNRSVGSGSTAKNGAGAKKAAPKGGTGKVGAKTPSVLTAPKAGTRYGSKTGHGRNMAAMNDPAAKAYPGERVKNSSTAQAKPVAKENPEIKREVPEAAVAATVLNATKPEQVAKVPEQETKPEVTEVPEQETKPEVTEVPEQEVKPEVTEVPEQETKPEVTEVPEQEATPEVTEVTPEQEVAPEVTEVTPEQEVAPEVTEVTPEQEVKPEVAEVPEQETKPEVAEVPEQETKPEVAEVPEQEGEEQTTFTTDGGQMAFIDGIEPSETADETETSEEVTPAVDENKDTTCEQLSFAPPVEENNVKDMKVENKDKETSPKDKKEKKDKATKKAEKKEKKLKKKKRGCCYHCCMTLLIFNFVCACVLICVGWIFGDQYCRQNLGLSLTETFGVYKGLTTSSGSFIDNAYGEEDEQGFYDSLGKALLLKELDGEELKSTVINGIKADELKGENNDMTDVFLDYASELFSRDNLDTERLDKIDAENPSPEDTQLVITDKQIAAFLNGVVGAAIDNFLIDELEKADLVDYGMDIEKLSIKEYVKLNQLKFFDKEYTIGGVSKNVDMLKATLSVSFGKALNELKNSVDYGVLMGKLATETNVSAFNQLSGVGKIAIKGAIDIIKSLLPNTLYLTIDMGLSESVEPTIYINNMGMGNKKMDNFYTLLEAVNVDLKSELNKLFTDEDGVVKSVIDEANKTVDLGEIISDGAIKCDVYQTIIDVTKLNYETVDGVQVEKPVDRQISSGDILGTMKLVLTDSAPYVNEFKSEEYSYKSYELVNGVFTFNEQKYDTITGEELDKLIREYEKEMLKAFADGYGLKTDRGIEEIIETFSETPSSDDIMGMFDAEKIKEIITGEKTGVVLTDRMLAALFEKMLPGLLEKSNAGISSEDVDIEFIYLEKKAEKGVDHYFLNIALSLKFDSLLSGMDIDQKVLDLINNLLPDKFIITMGMDITLNMDDEERLPLLIMLNGNNAKAIDKLITAFGVFKDGETGEVQSLEGFLDANVLSAVRDVLDGLGEALPGLTFEPSELLLPDIFVALTELINKENEGKEGYEKFAADGTEIKSALDLIVEEGPLDDVNSPFYAYGDNSTTYGAYVVACENAVLEEFNEKYGIRYKIGEKEYNLTQVLAIMGIGDKASAGLSPDDEDLDIYDLIDTTTLENNAFRDGSWESDLRVNLYNKTLVDVATSRAAADRADKDMFSALIRAVMFGSDSFDSLGNFSEEDLLFAQISEEKVEQTNRRYLTIAVKINVNDLMQNNGDGEGTSSFVQSLLPTAPSLIELKIDVTDGVQDYKDGGIIINHDADRTALLLKLLKSLDVDIEAQLSDICGNVRSAFRDFNENMGTDEGSGVEYDTTNNIIKLPNIFALMSDLVFESEGSEDKISASEIKTALKGIYTTSNSLSGAGDKTRLQIFEEKVDRESTKAGDNYEPFMKDMKSKYFLKGAAAEATTFDGLYELVGVERFDANYINLDGGAGGNKESSMAYDKREVSELKPLIDLSSLGAIMNEKMNDSLTEGESGNKYSIYSIDIHEQAREPEDERGAGTDRILVLYIKISLSDLFSGSEGDMSNLINVENIFLKASANLDWELTDESTGKTYYNSEIAINEMTDSEKESLFKVIGKLNGGNNVDEDIDGIEIDVGSAIYDAISTLDTSFNGSIEIKAEGEKGIEIADVYTFLQMNLFEDRESTATPAQIRQALQGMHPVLEGNDNANNYDYNKIVQNEIATEISDGKVLSDAATSGISDEVFGAYVAETINAKSGAKLVQFNILAGSDAPASGTNQSKDRQYLSDLGYELQSNTTYVMMTMEIECSRMMGGVTGKNINLLVPEKMLITFILQFNAEENGFDFIDGKIDGSFVMNGMTRGCRDVLLDMVGIDQNSTDNATIAKEADDCMTNLNETLGKFKPSPSSGLPLELPIKHVFTEETGTDTKVRGRYKVEFDRSALGM